MVDKKNAYVKAIIGPMDAYSIARLTVLTSHWNITHFSPAAISNGLRKVKKSINCSLDYTSFTKFKSCCIIAIVQC